MCDRMWQGDGLSKPVGRPLVGTKFNKSIQILNQLKLKLKLHLTFTAERSVLNFVYYLLSETEKNLGGSSLNPIPLLPRPWDVTPFLDDILRILCQI